MTDPPLLTKISDFGIWRIEPPEGEHFGGIQSCSKGETLQKRVSLRSSIGAPQARKIRGVQWL